MKSPSIPFVCALLAFGLLRAPAAVAQDPQAMMQAMERAQAAASKPGDDKLTCDQLEEQVIAVAQDPALREHIAAAGASAQKDQAAMDAAKGKVAVQAIRTAFMSIVPGGAMPGMMSAQAGAQAQGAQAASRVQSRMADGPKMMALMPTLMRGQRVIELGAAKGCEWAADTGAPQ